MKNYVLISLMLIMFLFCIDNVYALDISVDSVKSFDKSNTISVSNVTSNDLTIKPSITFNSVNDYVTYKISFKGNDLKKYKVGAISDNNDDTYIKTIYKYGDDLTEPVYVTFLYNKLANANSSLSNFKINISLISDSDGNTIVNRNSYQNDGNSGAASSNPQTGLLSHIMVPLVLILVTIFLLRHYMKVNNDVNLMILILCMVLIPFTIYAEIKETLTINIDTSDIIIKASTGNTSNQSANNSTPTVTKYYVYLYPNGGTGINDGQKFEYTGTTSFSNFPKVTKTNCTLDGWNVGSPTGKEYYQNVDATDNGQKLYARWSCEHSGAGNCRGSYTGKKYSLTEVQKQKIAGMLIAEYSADIHGMKAVASQMANLYEINSYYDSDCTRNRTFYEYITNTGKCGWYASADNASSSDTRALQAVEDVLINGNRTIPLYIDEFDMFPGDIIGAYSDSSAYQVGVSKLRNKYGGVGTYYCITESSYDANIFFYTDAAEKYRVAKGYAKGY